MENKVFRTLKKCTVFIRNKIAVASLCAVTIISIILSSCSSQSGSSVPSETEQVSPLEVPGFLPVGGTASTIGVEQRIVTQITDDLYEGWACISDQGEAFVYSFFDRGSIDGFDDTLLGLEIQINADTEDSNLAAQTKFSWQQQSADSLLLDVPSEGIKISFNNVRFTENSELTAYSSVRGQLYCSLQSETRS